MTDEEFRGMVRLYSVVVGTLATIGLLSMWGYLLIGLGQQRAWW